MELLPTFNVGAAVTVNVTGIVTGLFAICDEVIRIVPENVPVCVVAGDADTWSVFEGVKPPDGVGPLEYTFSQLPPPVVNTAVE
jgi:hypothetical protein